MPRRALKRLLPDTAKLKQNKSLQFLGHLLHEPGLWHLNRKSVAKAFFIGLFIAMLPIPSQMLAAALLAIWLNANLPISVSLVWVTNPLTMPPIFYFNYWLGTRLMGEDPEFEKFELSIDWIQSQLQEIWWPLVFGSVVSGLVLGILGFFALSGFWHWRVRRNWSKRQSRKQGN